MAQPPAQAPEVIVPTAARRNTNSQPGHIAVLAKRNEGCPRQVRRAFHGYPIAEARRVQNGNAAVAFNSQLVQGTHLPASAVLARRDPDQNRNRKQSATVQIANRHPPSGCHSRGKAGHEKQIENNRASQRQLKGCQTRRQWCAACDPARRNGPLVGTVRLRAHEGLNSASTPVCCWCCQIRRRWTSPRQ